MITIFTSCFPFTGPMGKRQHNSIKSWMNLTPTPEIIVTALKNNEDDSTIRSMADKYEPVRFIEIPEYNDLGLPLLNKTIQHIRKIAKNDILCIVNAHIIFLQDLIEAVRILKKSKFKEWIMTAQRWNTPVDIDIVAGSSLDTDKRLYELVKAKGHLESSSAADFHVFPRSIDWSHMPPFSWGRANTDTWFNADALERGIPLINATHSIVAIHPEHERNVVPGREQENQRNIDLAGIKSVGSDAATYFLIDGAIVPSLLYVRFGSRLQVF